MLNILSMEKIDGGTVALVDDFLNEIHEYEDAVVEATRLVFHFRGSLAAVVLGHVLLEAACETDQAGLVASN